MICEGIIGKLGEDCGKNVQYVGIDWFERDKHVIRKKLPSGEEIGIKSESPLSSGDIIFEDKDRIVVVKLLPCELLNVKISNIKEMGRVCFELGNRHLSLLISEDSVKCPYDEPTFEHLKKLGFECEKVLDSFEGFIECRAHGQHHGHSHG